MAYRSRRQQCINSDVEAIKKACDSDKQNPFQNFELCDDVLSFEYCKESVKIFYWINLSDDYPDNSLLTWSSNDASNSHETCQFNDRLPVMFNRLAKKMYRDLKLVANDADGLSGSSKSSLSTSGISSLSSSVLTADDSFDESEEEDDNYVIDEYQEEYSLSAQLAQDIEAVQAKFGSHHVSYKLHGLINECDVELCLPTDCLDAEVSSAWKLVYKQPVHIQLHFRSMSVYPKSNAPLVEVYQLTEACQKEKKGAHLQLEQILKTFISQQWSAASSALSPSHSSSQQHISLDERCSRSDEQCRKKLRVDSEREQRVAYLVELGFERSLAINALEACKGDAAQAAELLLNSDDVSELCNPSLARLIEFGFNGDVAGAALNACSDNIDEALSLLLASSDVESSSLEPAVVRRGQVEQKKSVARGCKSSPASELTTSKSTPGAQPTSGQVVKSVKEVPTSEHGFLVQIILYAKQRLQTLNEFCVICDETHIFENSSMLKPTVCARDLCVFAFQTLGVMSNAADEVATASEVVDLLIAMAKAACKSSRKIDILEPYPTIVNPHNLEELALNPKQKDFDKVQSILEHLLPMYEMVNQSCAELKRKLDANDSLAYLLLQWIIASNRSHIVKLSENKRLKFMNTPHQFLMWSSPPAQEASFVKARKEYGSTFAFHGSHIENWHSIVRRGLLNASGTKLQLHGAAHGSGIYLSPSASMSFGYSGGRQPRKVECAAGAKAKSTSTRFLRSENIMCIALCEVVTSPKLKKSGHIWVMPEPDHVCTRFFFVYEDGQCGDHSVDTQRDDIQKEIKNALKR